MQSYRRLQLSKSVKIQSRVNSDTNMSQVCHNNAELLFIYLILEDMTVERSLNQTFQTL